MSAKPRQTHETAVEALYQQLLACWNRRDAAGFAGLFEDDAYVVGFDGSPMHGRAEIGGELSRIFRDHETALYAGKVRRVRALTPDVAMLEAVAGLVPPGQTDIRPELNAMQTLVATRHADGWRIALYQNTPAQFHGRPEMGQALTEELRAVLQSQSR